MSSRQQNHNASDAPVGDYDTFKTILCALSAGPDAQNNITTPRGTLDQPSVQPLSATHDEKVPAPNPEIGAASVNTVSNIPVPADKEGDTVQTLMQQPSVQQDSHAPNQESGTWLSMFLHPAMLLRHAPGDVPIMQKTGVEIV